MCFKNFSEISGVSESPFAESNDGILDEDIEVIVTEMKIKTIDEFQELNQKRFDEFVETMNVKIRFFFFCNAY